LTEAWQEGGKDFATVWFLASLLDDTTDEAARLLDGSRAEPVKFEESWTVVRPVGRIPGDSAPSSRLGKPTPAVHRVPARDQPPAPIYSCYCSQYPGTHTQPRVVQNQAPGTQIAVDRWFTNPS